MSELAELKSEMADLAADLRATMAREEKARAEIERLLAVLNAARSYYYNYCQDEANEDGICGRPQQLEAMALRDAIASYDDASAPRR